MAIPSVQMSNGLQMPQFGFGTYKVDPQDATALVRIALEMGIYHIDTAQMYGNEKQVGQALVDYPREDLFITTKLNNHLHERADATASLDRSLADLGVDYVDLFLIHWPMVKRYGGNYPQAWQNMLDFQADGRARTVGVSNFEGEHLDRLRSEVGTLPTVNQIEIHPYFANRELVDYCQERGITVQAWSPLGRGVCLKDPVIGEIAAQVERTPAQVTLRWNIQRGIVVFPKASTKERIAENAGIFDFELTDTQMDRIFALDRGEDGRQGSVPNTMDYWPA
ncbi:MAG: aldo/keto reductase [Actinomycetaceae bacterium]|nr:aldo/keto reductase [Actinomycetaceae bacterium]